MLAPQQLLDQGNGAHFWWDSIDGEFEKGQLSQFGSGSCCARHSLTVLLWV